MTVVYILAILLFMALCALLCAVILVQEGKGGGLGASFGGDSSNSLFGTGTADVLRRFTGWLGACFLIGCLILSFWTEVKGRSEQQQASYQMEEFEN